MRSRGYFKRFIAMDFSLQKVCLCYLFIDFERGEDVEQRYSDIEDYCTKILEKGNTYPVPWGFYLGGERQFSVQREGYVPALDLYTYTERHYVCGTLGFVADSRQIAEELCKEFKTCYNYKHTCLLLDIEVDDLCTFD